MAGREYKSNNVSDEVKYTNLTNLVSGFLQRLPIPCMTYFELHSGPGRYRVGGEMLDGSAIRVLRMLRSEVVPHAAFLHEKKEELADQLEKNIKPFDEDGNISVYGDWKDEIEDHVHTNADPNSLFMIDPTHIRDYEGDDGLLCWLGPILSTGAAVFMYVPQGVGTNFPKKRQHAKIVNQIGRTIKDRHRRGLDLMHFTGRGHQKRIDHNIIVAGPTVLEELKKPHKEVCERHKNALKAGYPSFRDIR